ncbi:MAG: hypothetical protein FWE03_02830 [Firmicutes bacterium]|nr:hypothetical protein [Bacillota bacterium]
MEIFPTIEALLHYANAHLMLDELDYVYARNKILALLNLKDYEEYEINYDEAESMNNPAELLNALANFAVANKVVAQECASDLKRKIMDCVTKRPGEMADLFMGASIAKGFDFLLDYGVKSGYIQPVNKKWEAKATKGKIEVVYTGQDYNCNNEEKAKKVYPKCKKCNDNVGFSHELLKRAVPIELNKERMFLFFKNRPLMQNQGKIVSEHHQPHVVDEAALEKMFDFVNLMPNYSIAACASEHENFNITNRPTPFARAADLAKFKSKDYPYIGITTVDWYLGAVRLLSSNREKLIEYAIKLKDKWVKIEKGNNVAFSLRKIEANYCLEVIMLSDKSVNEEFSNFGQLKCVCNLLGVFAIGKNDEEAMEQVARFLTKEEKFSPAKLEGNLSKHSVFVNRIMGSIGNSKFSALEASLEVKDEINKTLENALISISNPIDALHGEF